MGLKQQIEAALKRRKAGKASADDVLNQIAALTAKAEGGDEDDTAAVEGEDEEEEAGTEEDDTAAESGSDEEETSEDEDKPAARKAKATEPKAGTAAYALAVLDLPEAKGREALARTLAAEGLPLAKVKTMLASAPKKAAFAPQNPGVAAAGAASPSDANARLLAAAAKVAEQAAR